VELLVSDFDGRRESVTEVVSEARPEVYAHNAEVVPARQRAMRDPRFSWRRSLDTLRWAIGAGAAMTKSSLMVGCGETDEQILQAMRELRSAGVLLLTLGQYLRPTPGHAPVARYLPPEDFEQYRRAALEMGFRAVAAGPLVRSSYRAHHLYDEQLAPGREDPAVGFDTDAVLERAG